MHKFIEYRNPPYSLYVWWEGKGKYAVFNFGGVIDYIPDAGDSPDHAVVCLESIEQATIDSANQIVNEWKRGRHAN